MRTTRLAVVNAMGRVHMPLLDNPFGWPVNIPPKVLDEAAALVEAARKTGLKSQREREQQNTGERK